MPGHVAVKRTRSGKSTNGLEKVQHPDKAASTCTVSVIIPVYNHAATVTQAIDSALAQEFDGSVEIIVTNDGSTDDTQEKIDSYGRRIKVIQQLNRGHAVARNAAIAQSQSEFLALLDADDFWLPGQLAKTVSALRHNPQAVLAFTDSLTIDNAEPKIIWTAGAAPSMEQLLNTGWTIFPSNTTFRRSALEACGGFNEQLRGLVDSYFLVLREQGEFEYIAEPLIVYRSTPQSRMADRYLSARKPFLRLVPALWPSCGAASGCQ